MDHMDGWHWGFGHWGVMIVFWVVALALVAVLLTRAFRSR